MSNSEIADLNKLKARATGLLPQDAPTTLYELVSLRQKVSDILLAWGPAYADIRLKIEALDFEPCTPAPLRNRPVTPDRMLFVPSGWNQEQLGSYLRSQMERYIRLIEAAQRLKKSEAVVGKAERRSSSERARRRRTRKLLSRKQKMTAPQFRASLVAHVIQELDVLKTDMWYTDSDYARLAKAHPDFLTFKTATKSDDLRRKVQYVKDSRRHIRLAQEIVALETGRSLNTIQIDWKKHKPQAFKRQPIK